MRIKQPLCALSLALLMAAPFTACSNDEANEPQPNTGKIVLNPQLGAEAWKDAAAGTRVPQDVTLAPGGVLAVSISGAKVDGDPDESTTQMNRFEIDGTGKKLVYLPKEGGGWPGESDDPLSVPRPGDYFLTSNGELNFTVDGVPFVANVHQTGTDQQPHYNKITIADDGKLEIKTKIVTAGIKLVLLNPDGTDYTGTDDVVATIKNTPLKNYNTGEEHKPASQTLTSTAATAIWGNISASSNAVKTGDELFTLVAGTKTYKLNYSGATDLILKAGNLYTFNVRVGGTELVLDGSHTIGDFVNEGNINAELKRDPATNP